MLSSDDQEEDHDDDHAMACIKKQAMEIHLLAETVTRKEHEIENLKIQTKQVDAYKQQIEALRNQISFFEQRFEQIE
jgi:predicted RNase H-like nuclease (RuvC/YqgF family)